MNLRIKEICKEQGIMLKDLADRINITEVGLSKSLNGNPTIGRLEEIAKALNVDFLELFEKRSTEEKPIYTKDESGKEIIIGYLKK
ncbi:helix-turn-helix domain-containing protein [Elizabethkingia anophelis]|uniref:helix-turn-helix domain-containing protein n=1 Tax=Elizabethkingia anophelis TaxID=1117645 RepID=UPI0016245DC5|nr:helix-turn-helix transcriptional regulator [Elizabethkingia anophelis]MCT4321817.1 helix-turn-helix transcriptional regulator [Elizabethkingia anophelis]